LPLPRPAWPAASPASSPLRDCYVPLDQSVLPDPLQAGPPSETARFPFAPRCRSLLLVSGLRSTFPSRYRFGGLLFLKPLGTSFTMLPPRFFVNSKNDEMIHFPRFLSALFQGNYGHPRMNFLWIKRRRDTLFLRYWPSCGVC
jgi:hypothetical protein